MKPISHLIMSSLYTSLYLDTAPVLRKIMEEILLEAMLRNGQSCHLKKKYIYIYVFTKTTLRKWVLKILNMFFLFVCFFYIIFYLKGKRKIIFTQWSKDSCGQYYCADMETSVEFTGLQSCYVIS